MLLKLLLQVLPPERRRRAACCFSFAVSDTAVSFLSHLIALYCFYVA